MDVSAVAAPQHVARPFRLEPFQALTLAARRIGDPASARALARPHASAPERLGRWERQGQLTRDTAPALYLHEYTAGGITVRGLVGGLDLSRRSASPVDRAVLPHEGVHPGQVEELAGRMAQLQVNPAPILLVHRGPASARDLLREVRHGHLPEHRFTDRAGQQHRVWAVRDPSLVTDLAEALRDARPLIADGHHRYGAYLRLQQQRPGSTADRGLAMLVDHDDTPLFLGAIHRVLAGTSFADVVEAAASAGLRLATNDRHRSLDALGPGTLVVTDGRHWGTVGVPAPEQLAVEVLHHRVVPALPRSPRVAYHHSAEAAIAQVERARGTAVLLPAPDVDAVLAVVAQGRLLPEKATSFQPKPSPGVLIRPLLA